MLKRSFDLILRPWACFSCGGSLGWVVAYFDTGTGGFFIQQRVVVTVGYSVLSNYQQCERIIL